VKYQTISNRQVIMNLVKILSWVRLGRSTNLTRVT